MVTEVWESGMRLVFVSAARTALSEKLGFPHVVRGDRFWELLETGGITPGRLFSAQERKALADGQADGSLSEPVRLMFIEKKISQLTKLGVGLTDLNHRIVAANDADRSAWPDESDVAHFVEKAESLRPALLAFVTAPDLFAAAFRPRYPSATADPGVQPFRIGASEVWLMGLTTSRIRGEALTAQEDLFFELGERMSGERDQ